MLRIEDLVLIFQGTDRETIQALGSSDEAFFDHYYGYPAIEGVKFTTEYTTVECPWNGTLMALALTVEADIDWVTEIPGLLDSIITLYRRRLEKETIEHGISPRVYFFKHGQGTLAGTRFTVVLGDEGVTLDNDLYYMDSEI